MEKTENESDQSNSGEPKKSESQEKPQQNLEAASLSYLKAKERMFGFKQRWMDEEGQGAGSPTGEEVKPHRTIPHLTKL